MKNLFLLFPILFILSCEPTVDFSAGVENRLTGIIDFVSWTNDFTSDSYMLGDCFDSEVCEITKYDDGDTGNERYYIDIIAQDYYSDPNNCYSDWDGMQHSLRIIATADEIENQFQITSGNFAIMGGNENPVLTIVYHLKRYSEEEGDQNLEYIGHVGVLDVIDLDNDDALLSGHFFGTVYRENEFGEVDSVMIKNIVFNNINVSNQ